MNYRLANSPSHAQRGGITILVVLSLLVLLTIAAVGMSRNSLREVLVVASSRQAASVRQAADAGLEFAILWADPQNPALDLSTAQQLRQAMMDHLHNEELRGTYIDIPRSSDTTLSTAGGVSQSFRLRLLRLGKLDVRYTDKQNELIKNDIWVVRSIGEVKLGSGAGEPDFQHHKEMWLTTPALTN